MITVNKSLFKHNVTGQAIRPVEARSLKPWQAHLIVLTRRKWISRNSTCPCGSGKRFKRCCGR